MQIERRAIVELTFQAERHYRRPFLEVELTCVFLSPEGKSYSIAGFYDGGDTWRVRFSPNASGIWSYKATTQTPDAGLNREGRFEVVEPASPPRGFLKTCPGRYWGLEYESGEPCLILGDTMYNIFGVAYCGLDVESVLRRRADQGFNLIRARVPVSPFHPPEGYSDWQVRSTWPWGGSPQKPVFDQFNLEYFRTVDRVVRLASELQIGFEVIMEAWGFEYPFNQRNRFTPEYEELWIRYLIARYDAFSSVYVWTLMNEYEFYPDGNWNYNRDADLWAVRIGRLVKQLAPHGHPVAVHNGPRLPPFAERFGWAPGVIDLIMFQDWGTRGEKDSWLAAGIEDIVTAAMTNWPGSFIFAEYGYERNPDLEQRIPSHAYCDPEHTRRGAWRGAFCGAGVIHGWENTWGPWWLPDEDQAGMRYLLLLREFFTRTVPYYRLRPSPHLLIPLESYEPGTRPLCMATPEQDIIVAYLPVGGSVCLRPGVDWSYQAVWYDPRTGAFKPACGPEDVFEFAIASPQSEDWILVLRAMN